MLKPILVIARKELVDHTRDIRSLAASLVHLLMGPLLVLLISFSHSANGKGSSALPGMMSIFILLAPFIGGMNVAMDVVAGERERRSLVPLLLIPVCRSAVAIGKWLATSLFSIAGLAIVLVAFLAVGRVAGVSNPLFSRQALLCWILLGLVPLVLLATAIQVAISSVCSTAKEAQTYLSFLIFLPMSVSLFFVFFPKQMGAWTAFVPLAGHQALEQTGMSTGHWPLSHALVLGLMTSWLAAATVIGAGKLLEQDSVVYGS